MTMAARAVTVVLGATAIVLATACTRLVDDARVVAAPDMGKAGPPPRTAHRSTRR